MSDSTFYVTTPIYYVNDAPHIGHGYTTVMGDIITRWHRQRGENVWYLTGTDEHGQKVLRKAEDNGVSPQQWVDKLVEEEWKPLLATLDVANDDFIRTTDQRHIDGSKAFWQDLFDRDAVYKGTFEGHYSVGSEEFVGDDDVTDGEGEDEGFKVSASSTAAGSSWLPRRTTSSSWASTSRSCSTSTRPTPSSSSPSRRATRSSRSSAADCVTSRSRGRRSTGASASRGTTSTSCTCGSRRCSTM